MSPGLEPLGMRKQLRLETQTLRTMRWTPGSWVTFGEIWRALLTTLTLGGLGSALDATCRIGSLATKVSIKRTEKKTKICRECE